MKVHFIAIGGSAMHNLALALYRQGIQVSGSDDEIFEPSYSRLKAKELLPPTEGWNPARITPDLDAVILGMHAKDDNPELIRAREMGLRIYSYPEFLFEHARDKIRVVIGGSHGKTTITAMILHVLQQTGIPTDYMVGAQLDGFDEMVRLTAQAPYMVLEGDEYLTSPVDKRPKFHLYKPHIALLSGIAWDHINVFPSFDNYLDQFRGFIDLIEPDGILIYNETDDTLKQICENARSDIALIPYRLPEYTMDEGVTEVKVHEKNIPLKVFGKHNLLNMEGARMVCHQLGVEDDAFYQAIRSFEGASNRLEVLISNHNRIVYRDFAHAPSKVRATVDAVRELYPGRILIACLELHTYSSLNKDFLPGYQGTMDQADVALVYFNPHALSLKRLQPITSDQIIKAFNRPDLEVFNDSKKLMDRIQMLPEKEVVYLMMSSGNFDGLPLKDLFTGLPSK